MKIILYIHKIDPTQTLYICINILSTLYFRFCSLLFLFLPYFFPFTSIKIVVVLSFLSSSFIPSFRLSVLHPSSSSSVHHILHFSNCSIIGWQAHSV